MLDPKTLKPGSVIRLQGEVVKIEKDFIYLKLEGRNSVWATFYPSDIEHAELISTPRPTISKEAAGEIKYALAEKKLELDRVADHMRDFDWCKVIDSFVDPEEK